MSEGEKRCPTCGGAPSKMLRDLAVSMGQATGLQLIEIERERQIAVEGWTPRHDAEHFRGELAIASALLAVRHTDASVSDPHDVEFWDCVKKAGRDSIRDLAKAGALIAAEIDRLRRTA